MSRLAGLIVSLLFASGALAEAPATSARPAPRPENVLALAAVAAAATAPVASLRPLWRPGAAPGVVIPAAAAPRVVVPQRARLEDPISALIQSLSGTRPASATPAAGVSALAVARSLRPQTRPTGHGLVRLVSAVTAPRATSRKGSVCGVSEIKGQAVGNVPGNGACGIDQAVRVASVSGVSLAQQPTIDCTTAKALNSWVREGVIPAVGRTGGGVTQLKIIAHYSCRSRNNKPGAKLSEHSFGHAVDVAGIVLKDGTTLTVLDHWRSSKYGRIIKAMHSSACGTFGTVLGPNSDRYHQNHLHVDTARYRGGSYCR